MRSFVSRRKQDDAFHALAGNRTQAFAVGLVPFFLHGKRVLLDFQGFEPEGTIAVGQACLSSGTQAYQGFGDAEAVIGMYHLPADIAEIVIFGRLAGSQREDHEAGQGKSGNEENAFHGVLEFEVQGNASCLVGSERRDA